MSIKVLQASGADMPDGCFAGDECHGLVIKGRAEGFVAGGKETAEEGLPQPTNRQPYRSTEVFQRCN